MSRKIFISHRHADTKFADVLRVNLQIWGVSNSEIFQSSSAVAKTNVWTGIYDSTVRQISECNLFIMIVTNENYDWSYCLWEAGIALGNPKTDTKLFVLSLDNYSPKVLNRSPVVKVKAPDILNFVTSLHRDYNLFGGARPISPEISDEALTLRATHLFNPDYSPGRRFKAGSDGISV